MRYGREVGSYFLPRRSPRGGGDLSGGGPNPIRGQILPQKRSRGGGVECGGGDSQLPLHRIHHLPQLPTWIPVGSRHGDRHPRGQSAPAGHVHEGGGPSCDHPGPAQNI